MIIALASPISRSNKTAVSANLAFELVRRTPGSVVAVDFARDGALTRILAGEGVPPTRSGVMLDDEWESAGLLVPPRTFACPKKKTRPPDFDAERLGVFPALDDPATLQSIIFRAGHAVTIDIRGNLWGITHLGDHVIIDTASGLYPMSRVACSVANIIVIPIRCDTHTWSEGLDEFIHVMGDTSNLCASVALLRTQYRRGSAMAREVDSALEESGYPVLESILRVSDTEFTNDQGILGYERPVVMGVKHASGALPQYSGFYRTLVNELLSMEKARGDPRLFPKVRL